MIKKSFSEIMKEEKMKEERIGDSRQGGMRKEITMDVVEELKRRKDKLVIMGIPEEGEDGDGKDIVKDVVAALMEEVIVEFKVIGRIGKRNRNRDQLGLELWM